MNAKSTREKFYAASLALFKDKGFRATTIRDIAKSVQVEAATIYNYVNSKQALLDQFVFEMAEKFSQGIHMIEASSYSPVEKLRAIMD